MSEAADFEPVAAVTRSGMVESVHAGAVAVVAANGDVVFSRGNPDAHIYGRSSNKPLQAQAMLDLGVKLGVEQTALACASHSGADEHIEIVESILVANGLDLAALQNTPTLPYDRELADAVVAAGGQAASVYQNCSGKHASMLATCVVNSWPIDTYLTDTHPLQLAITERVAELADGVVHVGVDGCGAPTHATTLVGLARAFSRLASAQGEVWQAMTRHPELVGGSGRVVTSLMRAVPGLLAKDGADGMFAAGLPDGRAVAVKVGDGSARAAGPVVARALQHAGVLLGVDPVGFGEPTLGHGVPVGLTTPLF